MAGKKNNPKTDPAALTQRVAVIEGRYKGEDKWEAFKYYHEIIPLERELVLECSELSQRCTGHEFRYRAATLTFDDDGRKCVIY